MSTTEKEETKMTARVGAGVQRPNVCQRADLKGERLAFWRRAIWRAHHHAATDSEARGFAEALLAQVGYADDASIAAVWGRWNATGTISFPKGFPS